jgi:hypothetical protein
VKAFASHRADAFLGVGGVLSLPKLFMEDCNGFNLF